MSISREWTGPAPQRRTPAARPPSPVPATIPATQACATLPASDHHGGAEEFWLRQRLEAEWLRTISGITPWAAPILAIRSAASHPTAPLAHLAAFRAGKPDPAGLSAALRTLGLPAAAEPPGPADRACLVAAWPFALALETLLASGGDDRLALESTTGLNRYGCAPWPRPDIIAFASCTASSLNPAQYRAAEQARRTLIAAAVATGPDAALQQASAHAADRILSHFGVADLASAMLAASGTDAALIVTGLLAAEHPQTGLTSIIVSPAETGSGVPDAVQARHFASTTPSGHAVRKGGVLEGLNHIPCLATIPLRDATGAPIPPAEIAAACEAAIAAALPSGRVVLHAIDGSKTGLAAPDRPTLLHLARRFGPALDIVVDACQARIEPALIRWYLSHGFPVLVTGSKFFGAPGFCGAVLFPRTRLAHLANATLPTGLASYAGRTHGILSRLCPGLLLRWAAALHSMAAFSQLPEPDVAARLDALGQSITRALRQDARLRLIPAHRPEGFGWSNKRSVFTFTVRSPTGWLDPTSLRTLYLALHDDTSANHPHRCQIGQPVQLGAPTLGGLRLALSAAQIAEETDQAAALATVVEKLSSLLDRNIASAEPHAGARPALVG